jgi:hypothetical protein
MWTGADAVEDCFNSFNGPSFGAGLTKVRDGIVPHGDAGSIGIILGGTHFTDNTCVSNISHLIFRDLVEHDRTHGVGTLDPLSLWRVG